MEQDRRSPAAEPLRKYRHLPAAGCFLAGVCAAILGVGVFGYQCLLWLRDGFWTPLEFARVMPEPHFIRLVGLQKIMDALWRAPLSVCVFVVGIVVAILGLVAMVRAQQQYADGAYVREQLRELRATKK